MLRPGPLLPGPAPEAGTVVAEPNVDIDPRRLGRLRLRVSEPFFEVLLRTLRRHTTCRTPAGAGRRQRGRRRRHGLKRAVRGAQREMARSIARSGHPLQIFLKTLAGPWGIFEFGSDFSENPEGPPNSSNPRILRSGEPGFLANPEGPTTAPNSIATVAPDIATRKAYSIHIPVEPGENSHRHLKPRL